MTVHLYMFIQCVFLFLTCDESYTYEGNDYSIMFVFVIVCL